MITIKAILKWCDALVATRPRITYTQDLKGRRSGVDLKRRRWVPGGKLDCSLSSAAVNYLAGAPVNMANPLWNVNIVSRLVATGLYKRLNVRQYKTLRALTAFLKPGDTMRGPGHVIVVRDGKRWLSFEGARNGYRGPYMRPRGWTDVARLISPEEFEGRILAARSKGKSYAKPLALLGQRSAFDGPRWAEFLAAWDRADKGMAITWEPAALVADVYVVLGAALKADGTVPEKFRRRLVLAKAALDRYPSARVLITGGKPRNGVTEAAAGKAWMVREGIDPGRVLTETAASSTIGNARGSLPVLRSAGAMTYALVSDASHLRRAQVEFWAAQLQIETAENVQLPLRSVGVLGFNDYGAKAVATAVPVVALTRATIATEVASLLRLTQQYNQALQG